MTISMHEASVGFFVPFLRNLSGLLDHAARHAEVRKIDPSVLLKMRLFPNMYDFAQQVKSRVAQAISFIQGLSREAIDEAADRDVTFRFKSGAERKFSGRSLLFTLSIPQFFFHLTTAYDILRHAGVEIAKKDFLGPV
jgi:uncharacterized protein